MFYLLPRWLPSVGITPLVTSQLVEYMPAGLAVGLAAGSAADLAAPSEEMSGRLLAVRMAADHAVEKNSVLAAVAAHRTDVLVAQLAADNLA